MVVAFGDAMKEGVEDERDASDNGEEQVDGIAIEENVGDFAARSDSHLVVGEADNESLNSWFWLVSSGCDELL